jgi:hypothetical protein
VCLFGLPFAAGGLFTSGMIFHSLSRWISARSWQETPATILTVETTNSDEDSFSTKATYRYEWDGKQFEGDRVSIHSGSDNIGSFQVRVANELHDHHKSGKPFRCFVNPDRPSESILYRDLRWELLSGFSVFGTLFGTIGFALIAAAFSSAADARFKARTKNLAPDRPWLWKRQWRAEVIRGEGRRHWLTWLAGYWIVVALPGFLGAVNAIAHGSLLAVFGLIIPGLGFWIARSAYRDFRRQRVYGRRRIVLDRFPFITGGRTSGQIQIENGADPTAHWRLKLQCRRKRGSGEDATTDYPFETSGLIEESTTATDWGRTAIPFEFSIPSTAPQTTDASRLDIDWKLTLESSRLDPPLTDEFVIPVFRTDESVSDFVDEHTATRARDEEVLDDIYPDAPLLQANLRVQRLPNGKTIIEAPAARDRKAIISLGIFVVLWMAGCAAVWNLDAPKLFPIIGGLCGLGLAYLWLDLLLDSSYLEIDHGTLTFRNGWAGNGERHCLQLEDVRNVTTKSNMTAGDTSYPNVILHLKSAEQVTIMRLIRGQPAAQRIVETILEAGVRHKLLEP